MAETVSQETIPAEGTPVIDSATPEQSQPVTPEVIREKMRNNEIKSPEEFSSLLSQLDESPAEATPSEAPKAEPTAPVSTPSQEVTQPDPVKETPVISDEFLSKVHEAGFTYRNQNEVVKGLVQKEKAVNTFKEDAIKNRIEAKEAQDKLERALKRQAELESLLNSKSQPAAQAAPSVTPQSALEMPLPPEMPKYSLDEDEYNQSLSAYNQNQKEYHRKLNAYSEQKFNQTISQVKAEVTQKISDKDSVIAKIQQENESNRLREEKIKELEKENKLKERAFEAANSFFKKEENKAYRLSRPIEDQYKEYTNLQNAIGYMVAKDPSLAQIAGQDASGNLIREYISENPYVTQAFASHDINITDDIKNYQLLVDLEADAYNHNDLDDQGRPDLEMALLRQKKVGGILLRERQDAKVEGFTEAQRLMQMNTSGAAQVPISAPSPSTKTDPDMTQEQLLGKLQMLKNLPPDEFKAEREKLLPFLAKYGIIQKE